MSDRQGGRKAKSAKATKVAPLADAGGLDAPSTLKLDVQCTLRESIAMKAALLEQLELGRDVVLDGTAVAKVDTAGLQLLAAFARQLQISGRQLSWAGVTGELQRSAAQLDLVDLIGLGACAVVQS